MVFVLNWLPCMHCTICLQVLYISMDKFLQGLFVLANDPNAEVRKLVSSFQLAQNAFNRSVLIDYIFTISIR